VAHELRSEGHGGGLGVGPAHVRRGG
jgi:hypothetical protein